VSIRCSLTISTQRFGLGSQPYSVLGPIGLAVGENADGREQNPLSGNQTFAILKVGGVDCSCIFQEPRRGWQPCQLFPEDQWS
jgi:hypothetical protein